MMVHLEQAQARLLAAEQTLKGLGYTYSDGSWAAPLTDMGNPPGPADRFIVRAFYERTKIPGVFHPGYPESAPNFVVNVMARAAQLQASEGGSSDE